MFRTIGALALALGLVGAGGRVGGQPTPVQQPNAAPCGQELMVAGTSSVYVNVEIPVRLIRIKARGVVLRDFPVREAAWIGAPPEKTFLSVMTDKKPGLQPVEIRPAKSSIAGEPAPSESQGRLDMSQVPSQYTVDLSEGVSISVQSHRTDSIVSAAYDELAGFLRLWAAQVASWTGQLASAPRRHLWVELSAEDARALYWALTPRTHVLVVPDPC